MGLLDSVGKLLGFDSPPPNYQPMADASEHYANVMKELGDKQIQMAQDQFNRTFPIVSDIAKTQVETQNQLNAQGRDYYDYNKSTFRPVEQAIADDVNKYNEAAEQERMAREAGVDVERAAASSRAANARAMASMGVNPNSARFADVNRRSGLDVAAMRAGAVTRARDSAKALGHAKRMDVAGLGRGLPGASTAAYSTAINAGNSAASNIQSPVNALVAGHSAGSSMIGQGAYAPVSAAQTILGNQTSMYNNAQSANAAVVGTAAGIGAGIAFSDRRMKANITKIGIHADTGLNVYEFSYIDGPDIRFAGMMADEVEKVMPEAVSRDSRGMMMVDYSKIGFRMQEVQR